MKLDSLVRDNLMTRLGYAPYCGNEASCAYGMPRARYLRGQFECLCGWRSSFDPEFIAQYEAKWTKSAERNTICNKIIALPNYATQPARDVAEGAALDRENHWRKLEGRNPAPPKPAPMSWPQDAPPLPHPELLGPDGMGTPSKAEIKAAMEADDLPAPDAMREALFKREPRAGGYTFVTAPAFPGWSFMLTPVCPEAREREMRLSFVAFFEGEVGLSAPVPPADEDRSGREYCFRIADTLIAAGLVVPVQPGAGEREAELLRAASRMLDALTADGDSAAVIVPADIDPNEFTRTFVSLANAIRVFK